VTSGIPARILPVVPVVAVLHHLEQPFLGHVGGPLVAAGLDLDERFLAAGNPLPELGGLDGIVSLGGEQSAVRADADPLLSAEARLLREAAHAGVPVLGICLGGQVLAHALGGRVRHVGRMVEWRELSKLPAAAADPLVAGLPEPVPAMHFNEDVFDAPPGAEVLLGPAPSGTAAFRWGERAWGLQYHPDADGEVIDRWIADYERDIGYPAGFRAASARYADAQARASEILFAAFARIVGSG
jgi:GMP synthase-like glutamine amidotransferase